MRCKELQTERERGEKKLTYWFLFSECKENNNKSAWSCERDLSLLFAHCTHSTANYSRTAYNISGNSIPLALQFTTSIGTATAHLNVISCVNTYSYRETNVDSNVEAFEFLLDSFVSWMWFEDLFRCFCCGFWLSKEFQLINLRCFPGNTSHFIRGRL